MTRTVALDSNVLFQLLGQLPDHDDATYDAMVDQWIRSDVAVVVLDDTMKELFEHGNTQLVEARLERLGWLAAHAGPDRLKFANVTEPMFAAERCGSPPPLWWNEGYNQALQFANDPGFIRAWHEAERAAVEADLDKDRYLKLDRRFAKGLRLGVIAKPPPLKDYMRDLPARLTPDLFFLKAIVDDEDIRARIASAPSDFPMHTAWVLLADLVAVAQHYQVTDRGDAYGYLHTERGAWIDARIAANAAYCDGFATHDTNLRRKLLLLHQKGLYPPEPGSLSKLI